MAAEEKEKKSFMPIDDNLRLEANVCKQKNRVKKFFGFEDRFEGSFFCCHKKVCQVFYCKIHK